MDTEWWSGPSPSPATEQQYSSQNGPPQTQLYDDEPPVDTTPTTPTTPNYILETSTTQEAPEYPDPSTTPTPNSSNVRTAPAGPQGPYQPSTRQPATLNYQAPPVRPTAPSPYNTTRSGWPAASGIPRQYVTPTVQTASAYLQGNYDDPTRRTAGSSFQPQYGAPYGVQTASSHFGGQGTAPQTSMVPPASYYQSRSQVGSTWSSEFDDSIPVEPVASTGAPQKYSAPFGENTTPGYQNQDSTPGGPTAPSGFGVNLAPAIRNTYPVQTSPSVQRETPDYFPAATRGRPQSMYSHAPRLSSNISQYEGERPGSPEDDSVGHVTKEMANSTLSGQSHRRSSVGTLLY